MNHECIEEAVCSRLCDNVFRSIYGTGNNQAKCCRGDNSGCNTLFGTETSVFCSTQCGTSCLGGAGGTGDGAGAPLRLPEVFCYLQFVDELIGSGLDSCFDIFNQYCISENAPPNPFGMNECAEIPIQGDGSPVCTDPPDGFRICCIDGEPDGLPFTPQTCDVNFKTTTTTSATTVATTA